MVTLFEPLLRMNRSGLPSWLTSWSAVRTGASPAGSVVAGGAGSSRAPALAEQDRSRRWTPGWRRRGRGRPVAVDVADGDPRPGRWPTAKPGRPCTSGPNPPPGSPGKTRTLSPPGVGDDQVGHAVAVDVGQRDRRRAVDPLGRPRGRWAARRRPTLTRTVSRVGSAKANSGVGRAVDQDVGLGQRHPVLRPVVRPTTAARAAATGPASARTRPRPGRPRWPGPRRGRRAAGDAGGTVGDAADGDRPSRPRRPGGRRGRGDRSRGPPASSDVGANARAALRRPGRRAIRGSDASAVVAFIGGSLSSLVVRPGPVAAGSAVTWPVRPILAGQLRELGALADRRQGGVGLDHVAPEGGRGGRRGAARWPGGSGPGRGPGSRRRAGAGRGRGGGPRRRRPRRPGRRSGRRCRRSGGRPARGGATPRRRPRRPGAGRGGPGRSPGRCRRRGRPGRAGRPRRSRAGPASGRSETR